MIEYDHNNSNSNSNSNSNNINNSNNSNNNNNSNSDEQKHTIPSGGAQGVAFAGRGARRRGERLAGPETGRGVLSSSSSILLLVVVLVEDVCYSYTYNNTNYY